MKTEQKQTVSGVSRRSFIKSTGVISLAGLSLPAWMPRMAFAASPEAALQTDKLICLFLRGGMDGLSAVVPYHEAHYYDTRPTIQVPSNQVRDLDGQFGLHPSMSPLIEIWQQQDLGIVHAAGSPDPTRSHFDAMDFMERGTPGEKSLQSGWLARHLIHTAEQNNSPFRAVGMGKMIQTSLQGYASAVAMQSIADFHLKGRSNAGDDLARAQRALQKLYDIGSPDTNLNNPYEQLALQAEQTFDAMQLLENANLDQYVPQHGAVYTDSSLGKALRQIAQLIRAQVGLEVACVDTGGWDTHNQMGAYDNGEMAGLLGHLATNLNAFYTDLEDEMAKITVVVMSEFGRRVAENGSKGLDHGHGNCMFLMGGGINGRIVHGNWPGLAPEYLERGDLAITTDFRDVLAEIVQERLGNSAISEIFPNYTPSILGVTTSGQGTVAASSAAAANAQETKLDNEIFLPLVQN